MARPESSAADGVQAAILRAEDAREHATAERCAITEWSNSASDPGLSIARARVAPGVTTRWHRLRGTVERYFILSGTGHVEIGQQPPAPVAPSDTVIIPPGCRQRITNSGAEDLVFLALCTPRFTPDVYEDIDPAPPD